MKTALVFASQGTIDFSEVRSSVIRIPEVISCLQQAQIIVDRVCPNPMDLIAFISSEDNRFWANERFRKLCVALVQIAMCKRYYKTKPQAKVLVAVDDAYSPLHVLTGKLSLAEFVESCLFKQETSNVSGLSSGLLPQVLSVYEFSEGSYVKQETSSENIDAIIVELKEESGVGRFINVGPCSTLVSKRADAVVLQDIQVEEMINMDPMLTWFWDSLKPNFRQIAN